VAFARLATMFTEAAGILHQLAQVPLAVRAQEALMCSVSEPAAPARLLTAEDLAARLQVDAQEVAAGGKDSSGDRDRRGRALEAR
jgi:hypothetical protein